MKKNKKPAKIRWLRMIFTIPLGCILLGGIFITVTWFRLPDVAWLQRENPHTTAFIQAEGKTRVNLRKNWVPLSQISPKLQRAVILAEDAAFWTHAGIDWFEIRESFKENLRRGKLFRGGSTLTQQVCKNLFLNKEKSFIRKLKEVMLAKKLEAQLTKKRILEIYLNIIQWGRGVYGIGMAAKHYFGKTPGDLTWDESIRLAAILPNPVRMNPKKTDQKLYWRLKVLLNRLHHYGDIDDLLYTTLKSEYNLLFRLGN